MQTGESLDDVRSKPGTILFIASLSHRAAMYHTFEILIDGNIVFLLFQELPHGMADVNLVGKDDIAIEGTIPMRLSLHLIGIPREKAVAVGQHQTFW